MLVLTRKIGSAITLTTPAGEKIEVVLVQIKDKQARIGIEAAKDVMITRKEVFDAINGTDVEVRNPLLAKLKT